MNTHKCTDTILIDALSSDLSFTWSDWAKAGQRLLIAEISKVMPMIRVWNHRSLSRHRLSKLSPALLDDIGLSAAQAQAECSKFFWEK